MSDMIRPQQPPPLTLTAATYRAVLTRDEQAKTVLSWLLQRAGFFQRIETEEQRLLHNWGIELLENMGMTGEEGYRRIVDAVVATPLPGSKE